MVLGHLLREAHAAVAEDAALAVDRHERRQLERLLEVALRLDEARAPGAPAERDVLERALAALVADRAVERVVHEQELDHRVLRVLHAVRGGVHDHAVAHRRGARGLQLRDALDLDEAHAAGADRLARASARNRSTGSRRRRAWRRRPASRPRARAPAAVDLERDPASARGAPLHLPRFRHRGQLGRAERLELLEVAPRPGGLHVHLELGAEVLRASTPTGIAIESPSTHRQLPMMLSWTCSMMSRSIGVASPCVDPLEHLHGPVRALAARHALAARLVPVELGEPQRERHERLRVVDHDDRAGAEHRAGLRHGLVGEGQVEVLLGQHRRRRAAREEALEVAPLGRAAARARR